VLPADIRNFVREILTECKATEVIKVEPIRFKSVVAEVSLELAVFKERINCGFNGLHSCAFVRSLPLASDIRLD
jgi:hypothetical protein